MRRWWVFAFVIAVAGCGAAAPEAPAAPMTQGVPSAVPETQDIIPEPDFSVVTDLALVQGRDKAVRVGDDVKSAMEAFPMPRGAYEFSEVPTALNGKYKSRGWESDNDGFGVLYINGKVAVAMVSYNNVDFNRYAELVGQYERAHKGIDSTFQSNQRAQYRFWQQSKQLLMICAVERKPRTLDVTVAVGDEAVMKLIRADQESAKEDLLKSAHPPTTPQ